mmetsp:Transcript_17401/g.44310  ORF Transcript_17401/g.44310 Transcript_17401/m.44310 type:complete len:269 (+) Transcript_17401:200-1006(+)
MVHASAATCAHASLPAVTRASARRGSTFRTKRVPSRHGAHNWHDSMLQNLALARNMESSSCTLSERYTTTDPAADRLFPAAIALASRVSGRSKSEGSVSGSKVPPTSTAAMCGTWSGPQTSSSTVRSETPRGHSPTKGEGTSPLTQSSLMPPGPPSGAGAGGVANLSTPPSAATTSGSQQSVSTLCTRVGCPKRPVLFGNSERSVRAWGRWPSTLSNSAVSSPHTYGPPPNTIWNRKGAPPHPHRSDGCCSAYASNASSRAACRFLYS